MKKHVFLTTGEEFDPPCEVCGGKCRDAVHGATDAEREATAVYLGELPLPDGTRFFLMRAGRGGQYLHTTGEWHNTTDDGTGTFTGLYPTREAAVSQITR